MLFSIASAALAFAVTVSAQVPFNVVTKPSANEKVPAGKTYTVVWTVPAAAPKGTVQILLVGGASQGEQKVLDTLETGYDNTKGTYDWDVDASLGALNIYGLKFELESNTTIHEWSPGFTITGGSTGGSSSSSSSSSKPTSVPTTVTTVTSITDLRGFTTTSPTSSITDLRGFTTASTTTAPPAPTGNTTVPPTSTTARVPPNAAAGLSSNGALAFLGGLAVLVFAL